MNEEIRRYTLYIKYFDEKVLIYSANTLREIDDFTTYFLSEDAICRMIIDDLDDCNIFIESNTKHHDIAYYNNRAILDDNNFQKIFDKIRLLDKKKINEYFYKKCKLEEYSKAPNANNIPLVNLHKALVTGSDFFNKLKNFLLNNYNEYRKFVIYFFQDENLNTNMHTFSSEKKEEIAVVINRVKEKCKQIKKDYLINNKEQIEKDNDMMGIIQRVISNNELTYEEKITELEMLKDIASLEIKKYIEETEKKL